MRKNYIDYIKFLAVLLVLNSHLDSIYPISALAAGGGIGNALFFLISGYTWANIRDRKYLDWYIEKAKRIFIPTVITNIVYVIIYADIVEMGFADYFKLFIYPNKSWFCGAIMAYALVYYWCARKSSIILYVMSILTLIYTIWYIFFIDKTGFVIEQANVCRFCYYCLCMMAGLIIRDKEQKLLDNSIKSSKKIGGYAILAIVTFVGSYGFKLVMNHYTILMWLQFLCQIMNLACVVCIFMFFQSSESNIANFKCNGIVKKISSYSWEIYLTQTLIIPLCVDMSFPVNLVLILLVISVTSYILKRVCKFLIR